MPRRREVPSLEALSLGGVGQMVGQVAAGAADWAAARPGASVVGPNPALLSCASSLGRLLQASPRCLQPALLREALAALSALLAAPRTQRSRDSQDVNSFVTLQQEERRRAVRREQAVLAFPSLLCRSSLTSLLLSPLSLQPSLVRSLAQGLPDLPHLTCLDLGPASCRLLCLLSPPGRQSGSSLMFLPNLRSLAVTDVTTDWIHSLSLFCPRLSSFSLSLSELEDEAAAHLATIRTLRNIKLTKVSSTTPFGFAELLRGLPELTSLGRCDCFGEVVTTLYHHCSGYIRAVGSVPATLALEEVECGGPVSSAELCLLSKHCPSLRHLGLVYGHGRREEAGRGVRGEVEGSHLSPLVGLQGLHSLEVGSADFYSHSLFTLVTQAGPRLTTLELSSVDELNLAALLMIGGHCPLLSSLAVQCCHYTTEQGDTARMEATCTEANRSSSLRRPFQKLTSASFLLTSPLHTPIVKYPVYFAAGLEQLQINQVYQPLEDSFLSALVSWSPLLHLRKFELNSGPHLTLMAANVLIQACPSLEHIGGVSSWGGVEREELEMMKGEVKARNLALAIQ